LESNRIIYIPLILYIPRHEKRGPGITISIRLLRRALTKIFLKDLSSEYQFLLISDAVYISLSS